MVLGEWAQAELEEALVLKADARVEAPELAFIEHFIHGLAQEAVLSDKTTVIHGVLVEESAQVAFVKRNLDRASGV